MKWSTQYFLRYVQYKADCQRCAVEPVSFMAWLSSPLCRFINDLERLWYGDAL